MVTFETPAKENSPSFRIKWQGYYFVIVFRMILLDIKSTVKP